MNYSIVIPTYNHCDDLLIPCITSILKYTDMTNVELVISANGCKDNTYQYLNTLINNFNSLGFSNHIKVVWSDEALGFAKAVNAGLREAIGEKVILLNNDTILLEQTKNLWINLLNNPFIFDEQCGISCPIKQTSIEANHDFAVFFCVMLSRNLINKLGYLNEDYGTGGGEDVEYCIEAEKLGFKVIECTAKNYLSNTMYTGSFPIYHAGERTVLDLNLVSDYVQTYHDNGLKLAKKYNLEYYRKLMNNNYERHLSINGETVPQRETARYKWASENIIGTKVLELGCSNGYGTQFLSQSIEYLGLDYDPKIIEAAKLESWGNRQFECADINTYNLGQYDTIIAMEVIEHLDNGLEIVEKLKKHCKRLLITMPYKEPPGFWGEHHKLHWLDETHVPGFEVKYCDEYGNITDTPVGEFSLMVCKYDS